MHHAFVDLTFVDLLAFLMCLRVFLSCAFALTLSYDHYNVNVFSGNKMARNLLKMSLVNNSDVWCDPRFIL